MEKNPLDQFGGVLCIDAWVSPHLCDHHCFAYLLLLYHYHTSLPHESDHPATMSDFPPWAIIIFILLGCGLLVATIAGVGRMYIEDTSAAGGYRPSDIQASYMREVRERNQMDILHKMRRGRGNMQRSQPSYTNYTDYSSAAGVCKSSFTRSQEVVTDSSRSESSEPLAARILV